MITNVLQDKVVLYHGNCLDGFSGAWVARKKFGNEAFYYGLNLYAEVPVWLKDKEVYFIDFCYETEIMKKIIAENKKVVLIDHHLAREEIMGLVSDSLIDITHCGSVLAWKYFFPEEKMPKLLDFIEDGDIWVWKNEYAKEVLNAISLRAFTFENWDDLACITEDENLIKGLIHDGSIISEYQNRLIDGLVKTADEVEFDGERALIVNTPILTSETGHALARNGFKIGILWNQEGRNIKVSLRGDGTINLAELAKNHGGGGHHNASGFSFKEDQNAPWNLIERKVDK